MDSNTKKGDLFEQYVESLYQGLGFYTERNVLLNGQQVDIIAKKVVKGLGNVTLIIECKYLSKGSVSNQVIYDFESYLKSSRDLFEFTKGVIVTNMSFSKMSKSINSKIIELRNSEGLENEIFDLSEACGAVVNDYLNGNMSHEYISCVGKFENHTICKNLEQYLIDELTLYKQDNFTNFFSILGDYGSGKTTLLKRVNYLLCRKYIENRTLKKPLYIELKNFGKYKDLELFMVNSYFTQFKKQISFHLLNKEIKKGGFILLFDGFDEMSPQANRRVRFENFKTLTPLILSNSLTFLSCRPSYFVTHAEYKDFLGTVNKLDDKIGNTFLNTQPSGNSGIQRTIENTYTKLFDKYTNHQDSVYEFSPKSIQTIELLDFSEEQVNLFLVKFNQEFIDNCGSNSEEVKEFLLRIYDLRELMAKPLLLSMIKDTILSLGLGFKGSMHNFSPSGLYEIYTNINLDVEWKKGITRHFLTKIQRRKFAEVIAFLMFEKSILEVSYDQIIDLINSEKHIYLTESLEIISDSTIEDIASDLQICTFLTRTEDDKFRFIHKSFMEFFVARHIKNLIFKLNAREILSNRDLPHEILYFLGAFGFVEVGLMKKLRALSRSKESNNSFRRNVYCAFIFASPLHSGFLLKDVSINEVKINKNRFVSSQWSKLEFIKSSFNILEFFDNHITSSLFLNCSFSKILFHDSDFICSVKLCTFSNVEFKSSVNSTIDINSEESSFDNGLFDNVSLSIGGDCKFLNTRFKNCNIELGQSANNLVFDSCTFIDTSVSSLEKSFSTILKKCDFENVKFESITLAPKFSLVSTNKFVSTSGKLLISISNDGINYKEFGFDKKTRIKEIDINLFLTNEYSREEDELEDEDEFLE